MYRYKLGVSGKSLGEINLPKFRDEIGNWNKGCCMPYLITEEDYNIYLQFNDIKEHIYKYETITYTRHWRVRENIEGKMKWVDKQEDFTSQMEAILAEIEKAVSEHDPTPVEPSLSPEQQRIADLEAIVADLMLGGM